MFLRWGAVYSRAHLISAIRAVFVYSLCVSLALPGGAAFAALHQLGVINRLRPPRRVKDFKC